MLARLSVSLENNGTFRQIDTFTCKRMNEGRIVSEVSLQELLKCSINTLYNFMIELRHQYSCKMRPSFITQNAPDLIIVSTK